MVVSRNLLRLFTTIVDHDEITNAVNSSLLTVDKNNCSDIERIFIYELLNVFMLPF